MTDSLDSPAASAGFQAVNHWSALARASSRVSAPSLLASRPVNNAAAILSRSPPWARMPCPATSRPAVVQASTATVAAVVVRAMNPPCVDGNA